ncbi:uncharacterized protein LOC135393132 [Ornithodoros turicata]|uniref:uncharacterized protein LOC135393132 n=1 Tax=Ornithodoros turicata TaxID=34597 RepID=UPI003138FE6B
MVIPCTPLVHYSRIKSPEKMLHTFQTILDLLVHIRPPFGFTVTHIVQLFFQLIPGAGGDVPRLDMETFLQAFAIVDEEDIETATTEVLMACYGREWREIAVQRGLEGELFFRVPRSLEEHTLPLEGTAPLSFGEAEHLLYSLVHQWNRASAAGWRELAERWMASQIPLDPWVLIEDHEAPM